MKAGARFLLKFGTMLLATVVAFCIGFFAGGSYCDRWVMPGLIKQYPHDGQLGLEATMYAILGGLGLALVVFVAGIIWIVKTTDAVRITSQTGRVDL